MDINKNAKLLSPSMLSADFACLEKDLKAIEQYGADWLHVDVMDGHFVPNITFGPDQMKCLKKVCSLPFDVHLMISDPEKYIPRFIECGADLISVHVETDNDIAKCFDFCDEKGVRKGLVLSPDTEAEAVIPWLDRIDLILVMSVYPGFGGQSYIKSSSDKIRRLKELIGDRNILIEVDGGVKNETAQEILDAGCDVLVAGSAVFGGDIKKNIADLKEYLNQ